MWHEERLLVDGELVASEGARTFTTVDPTTEARSARPRTRPWAMQAARS